MGIQTKLICAIKIIANFVNCGVVLNYIAKVYIYNNENYSLDWVVIMKGFLFCCLLFKIYGFGICLGHCVIMMGFITWV